MEQSPSWEANRFAASQNFPAFYGVRRFITAFTSARHLSLSWASLIQSTHPIPLPEDPFYYYPPIYVWVSFPQVSPPKSCIRLYSPHTRYMPSPFHSRFYHTNSSSGTIPQTISKDFFFFFEESRPFWSLPPPPASRFITPVLIVLRLRCRAVTIARCAFLWC